MCRRLLSAIAIAFVFVVLFCFDYYTQYIEYIRVHSSYMCDSKLHGIENIWPDFDSSVSDLKSDCVNRERELGVS